MKKTPLAIIGILFFIFGFITWLNSVLVPFLKISCELNHFESYFVTFVFYIAYFIFALPSAKVIDKIGYRKSITVGLAVMALGALLFIPASLSRYYLFFLSGLFLMGAGLALLQTAANPYAAILGPPETAARRISIMGICNKFAGVLAPLVFGTVALKAADEIMRQLEDPALGFAIKESMLDELAHKCLIPYILIVIFLTLLSLFVKYSNGANGEQVQSPFKTDPLGRRHSSLFLCRSGSNQRGHINQQCYQPGCLALIGQDFPGHVHGGVHHRLPARHYRHTETVQPTYSSDILGFGQHSGKPGGYFHPRVSIRVHIGLAWIH